MRHGRLAARGAAVAFIVVSIGACRAIAGIDSDLTYVPEGGASDDATAACPTTRPESLFTTKQALGTLFVSATYVYAAVVTTSVATYDPYNGVIGCAKAGCDGKASVVTDYSSADAGLQWGGAAASATSLYLAISTLSETSDDEGDDSGAATNLDGGSPRGVIETAGFNGGTKKPIVSGLGYPFFIATTSDSVYWVNDPVTMTGGSVDAGWQVFRCPLAGCTKPSLFMSGGAYQTYGFFVDTSNAYVVAGSSTNQGGSVYVCATDGGCGTMPGAAVTNVDTPYNDFNGSDPLAGGDSFVSDGTYLYMASVESGQILRIVPSTHESTTLATEPACVSGSGPCPINLAIDPTYLYWNTQNGLIDRIKKDGTGAVEPILCGLSGLAGLAVDDTSIYFTTVNASNVTNVQRVPLP